MGVLCVLSLLLGISVAAGVYSVRDPTYSCLVDVLPSVDVNVDPSQPIVGTITTFPLGLQCTFITTDGDTVIERPGWSSSALAGMSLVALFGAGVAAVGLRQRQRLI